jgi:putative tricarboxylic transport membrane protein
MKSKIVMVVLAVAVIASLVFVGCEKAVPTPSNGGGAGPEGYPERPITMLIGYGAGGGTDLAARAVGSPLSQIIDQNIVYVNLPGGAGAICEDYLLAQPADGYTILCTSGDLPINLVTGRNTHSIDDYIPFARAQMDTATIMISAKDSRYSNIDEFVDYAKANRVTIGGTGAGGLDEIVVALFVEGSGIQAEYVTYESAGKMRAAVVAGDIDACHEEFGPAISLIESGDIKPIVVFNDERVEGFPDLPCSLEKGFGEITPCRNRGFVFAAGVPEAIIDYMEEAIHQAYLTDEYQTWEKEQYLHLKEGWADRAAYTQDQIDQLDLYRDVLTKLGYL